MFLLETVLDLDDFSGLKKKKKKKKPFSLEELEKENTTVRLLIIRFTCLQMCMMNCIINLSLMVFTFKYF